MDDSFKLGFILARGWTHAQKKGPLLFKDHRKVKKQVVDLETAWVRERGRDNRGCYTPVALDQQLLNEIEANVGATASMMELGDETDLESGKIQLSQRRSVPLMCRELDPPSPLDDYEACGVCGTRSADVTYDNPNDDREGEWSCEACRTKFDVDE